MSVKERKRKSAVSVMSTVLMLCGIVMVVTAAVVAIHNMNEDKRAGEASQKIVSELRQSLSEQQHIQSEYPDLSMTVKEIDGFDYVGYLTIPDLKLELPVMSDWDYNKLKYSPCRYSGWAGDCDMVIAAHSYRKHFAKLTELELGARVYFTDMNGYVYDYEVGDIEILTPTDIDKMKNSDWDLSLYTCNYGATGRVTVRCKQTNKLIGQIK